MLTHHFKSSTQHLEDEPWHRTSCFRNAWYHSKTYEDKVIFWYQICTLFQFSILLFSMIIRCRCYRLSSKRGEFIHVILKRQGNGKSASFGQHPHRATTNFASCTTHTLLIVYVNFIWLSSARLDKMLWYPLNAVLHEHIRHIENTNWRYESLMRHPRRRTAPSLKIFASLQSTWCRDFCKLGGLLRVVYRRVMWPYSFRSWVKRKIPTNFKKRWSSHYDCVFLRHGFTPTFGNRFL